MVSFGHRLLFSTRGVLVTLPARFRPMLTKKPKGLKWKYHLSAANRRFRFPSSALLWFSRPICARRLLTAPVAERERSMKRAH